MKPSAAQIDEYIDEHIDEYYDVIVVGLGAMGSATLEQLSRTGHKVLGIEQFHSPHHQGSSHGETRIIRQAYFEDPRYVPLLQRAYTLWQDLETRAKRVGHLSSAPLLRLSGGLMLGPAHGTLIQGTLDSVKSHQLPHDFLSSTTLQHHPYWQVPADYAGVYEAQAGVLWPEHCIATQLKLAESQGATLWQNTRLLHWQADPKPTLQVEREGKRYWLKARRLILTTGAWIANHYPPAAHELQVTRQSLFWFKPPNKTQKALTQLPIFLLEMSPEAYLYGFPLDNGRLKVALHQPGSPLEPEDLPQQAISTAEIQEMRDWLSRYLKWPVGDCVQTAVCMYTNTPDGHFRWYTSPDMPQVLALSACSGHGFKFASVMGELCKQWALDEPIAYDLSLFQPKHIR